MKTTHLFALVAVLTVAGLSSVRAGEWGGDCRGGGGWGGERGGEWNYFDHVGAFCKEHGVKFSHGYFYPGLVQKHFTEKWYDEHFQTYMNWDPHAHCPYYFCEGHGVWYPIHYIEKVGPGAKGPGPVVGQPGPGGPGAGPAPGGPVPDAAPGGQGPNGPAVVPNGPNGGPSGPNVAPAGNGTPAGPQGVTPAPNPPAPGNTGTGSPPPEPTSSDTDRVARAQTPAARDIPKGTFEDAIPETK